MEKASFFLLITAFIALLAFSPPAHAAGLVDVRLEKVSVSTSENVSACQFDGADPDRE